ncbi:hypothetical protein [Cellulomonas sp.]|uniref:hypothetical protein n=1 Tax=Cellulomonas sp. TaxID=40001 RepID=UPI002E354678|nr:hypothetical protein [Cellulomonas sp.]
MTRPYSWFPLAAVDPVPGDPQAVLSGGLRYRDVADKISSAASLLGDLTSTSAAGAVSDAVDTIRDASAKVAAEITTAHGRYRDVGDALVAYAQELSRAQEGSLQALHAAQSAQQALDHASAQVRTSARALDDAVDEAERTVHQTRLHRARTSRDEADASLSRARGDLEEAVALRDQAARRAIDAIEASTGSDDLNDGWWDNWGSKVAHAVSSVAGMIASVAGVAALVLAWVPVLGEALAAVAVIAGAVALVADIALLIAGEGDWKSVALGVLGLATFGAGRVAGVALKMGARGAFGSARLAAGSAAAFSPVARGARGLSTARSAVTAIDEMAGVGSSSITRVAARGMASETAALTSPQGIREMLAVLRPGTVVKDLGSSVAGALTRTPGAYASWGDAFTAGGAGVRAALHAGPSAAVAALTGESRAVESLVALDTVAAGLRTFSSEYSHAVTMSNVAVGVAAGVAGADKYVMGMGCVAWVSDTFAPSAVDALGLN